MKSLRRALLVLSVSLIAVPAFAAGSAAAANGAPVAEAARDSAARTPGGTISFCRKDYKDCRSEQPAGQCENLSGAPWASAINNSDQGQYVYTQYCGDIDKGRAYYLKPKTSINSSDFPIRSFAHS